MYIRVLAIYLVIGVSVLQAVEPTDLSKIQGVWQGRSIESDDVDADNAFENARFVFEGDLVTIYQSNKWIRTCRFGLNATSPIPEIDFANPSNPTPETSMQGVYRFQGESLHLCFGELRPQDFRDIEGADLMVLDRPEAEATEAVPAWCLDVSPDGRFLAAAGGQRNRRGVVTLFHTEDWSVSLAHAEQRAATCLAFSPDGKQLAIGTQIGEVAILNLETQTVEQRWHTESWAVFGITWTPDGRDVIAACANGLLKRFCADCGSIRATFDTWKADAVPNPKLGGHADRNLWDAAVKRDGTTMLTGGWNGTTRLWNLTTGKMIQAFPDVERSTQGVKFMPDERHIVTNGLGSDAVIVRTADSFQVRAKLDAKGRDVAVHPDGQLIAAATLNEVRLFRLDLSDPSAAQKTECQKLLDQVADPSEQVHSAAAKKLKSIGLPADSILEEASRNAQGESLARIKQIQAEIESPEPVATLTGHPSELRQVVVSPTGNFLATSTIAGMIWIWNPETCEVLHKTTLMELP